MKNKNLRLVALSDGTGMGDEVLVFKTNAPVNRLKELEKQSCEVYINGGDSEDVPMLDDPVITLDIESVSCDEEECKDLGIYTVSDLAEWCKNKEEQR